MPTISQLQTQLNDAAALLPHFQDAAARYAVPVELLLGIGSRESALGRYLLGDGGAAHGVMQIHTRWHPDYQAGPYAHAENIDYGARFFAQLYRRFEGDTRAAAAAYNAGAGAVASALRAGADPDSVTTGDDYGADVHERAEKFAALLGTSSVPGRGAAGGAAADVVGAAAAGDGAAVSAGWLVAVGAAVFFISKRKR